MKFQGNNGKYIGSDKFTLHTRNYLCIVNYHSKFPVIKKMEDSSADSLPYKIIFSESGLPKKLCQMQAVILFT